MRDYALYTDLYQINMAYAFFKDNMHERKAVFDLYFRENPVNSSYAVFAGLQRVVEYIENFHFSKSDIAYLKSLKLYDDAFLKYLSKLKFKGNIRSVKEGEVVFAKEPLIIVEASLIQAQLIETALLNMVNFQTLIATVASRFCSLAPKQMMYEFGARRAQELDAALWGSRATYLSGFDGTSLVEAGKRFNIPIVGTHSHSFVQAYQDEYTAFKKYAESHKHCTFLLDTYDTLNSGLPNAIKVADEMKGKISFDAIRLDSGDLAAQSKEVRKRLDKAGYQDTKIILSNDLGFDTIASLLLEKTPVDIFGIGTKLITSYQQPSLGGVYKLVAIENDEHNFDDVIKISASLDKITTPGIKKVVRIISNKKNKAQGDLICMQDESCDGENKIEIHDESNQQMFKTVRDYRLVDIHHDIYQDGKLVYQLPDIEEIKAYNQKALDLMDDEHKRYKNPDFYYVGLSQKCYENKQKLIKKYQK